MPTSSSISRIYSASISITPKFELVNRALDELEGRLKKLKTVSLDPAITTIRLDAPDLTASLSQMVSQITEATEKIRVAWVGLSEQLVGRSTVPEMIEKINQAFAQWETPPPPALTQMEAYFSKLSDASRRLLGQTLRRALTGTREDFEQLRILLGAMKGEWDKQTDSARRAAEAIDRDARAKAETAARTATVSHAVRSLNRDNLELNITTRQVNEAISRGYVEAVMAGAEGNQSYRVSIDEVRAGLAEMAEEDVAKAQAAIEALMVGFDAAGDVFTRQAEQMTETMRGIVGVASRVREKLGFAPITEENAASLARMATSVVQVTNRVIPMAQIWGDFIGVIGGVTRGTHGLSDVIAELPGVMAAGSVSLEGVSGRLGRLGAVMRSISDNPMIGALRDMGRGLGFTQLQILGVIKEAVNMSAAFEDQAQILMEIARAENVAAGQMQAFRSGIRDSRRAVANLASQMRSTGDFSTGWAQQLATRADTVRAHFQAMLKSGLLEDAPKTRVAMESIVAGLRGVEDRTRVAGTMSSKYAEAQEQVRLRSENVSRAAREEAQAIARKTQIVGRARDSMGRFVSSQQGVIDKARSISMLMRTGGAFHTPMVGMTRVVDGMTAAQQRAAMATQRFGLSAGQAIGVLAGMAGVLGQLDPAFAAIIGGAAQMAGMFQRAILAMSVAAATGSGRIRAAFQVIGSAMAGFGIAAAGIVVKTGLLAANVETLQITMRQVARIMAEDAGADVEKFTAYVDDLAGSLSGITTRESIQAVTMFLKARLPLAMEASEDAARILDVELGEQVSTLQALAEAAKNTGVTIANMSSSQVMGRYIEVIMTGNSALLKGLNIQKTVFQMTEEYAAAIGKNVKAITVQEKRQAIINGLLAEASSMSGVYNEAMKTTSKQLGSMKRHFEELILVIGNRFLKLLEPIVFGFNEFLAAIRNLPDSVLDTVGTIISLTATVGLLTGVALLLAPALTSVWVALGPAMPLIAGIGLAIGALSASISILKKGWREDWGGIQEVVADFRETWTVTVGKIIGDVKYWILVIKDDLSRTMRTFALLAERVFERVADALGGRGGFQRAFEIFSDVVNVVGSTIHELINIVNLLLAGRGDLVVGPLRRIAETIVAVFIEVFDELISVAKEWGRALIINLANGIYSGLGDYLTEAMNGVGEIMRLFLMPGSDPARGPLSHLTEWGRGIMEQYLRAFSTADFGLFKAALAPIRGALMGALSLGRIDTSQFAGIFGSVRGLMAELIGTFRQTGEIAEPVLAKIADALGAGNEELVEFLRLNMEYLKAQKELEGVEAEIAEAEERGFVPADLKTKLRLARENAEKKRDEVAWQKELIAFQQDGIDLQIQLANSMKKAAQSMERLAAQQEKAWKESAKNKMQLAQEQHDKEIALLHEKQRLGLISEEDLLRGLLRAEERYVDAALALGRPVETNVARIMELRRQIAALGQDVTGEDESDLGLVFADVVEKLSDGIERSTLKVVTWSEGFEKARVKAKELLETLAGTGIVGNLRSFWEGFSSIFSGFGDELRLQILENLPEYKLLWEDVRSLLDEVKRLFGILTDPVLPEDEEAWRNLGDEIGRLIAWDVRGKLGLISDQLRVARAIVQMATATFGSFNTVLRWIVDKLSGRDGLNAMMQGWGDVLRRILTPGGLFLALVKLLEIQIESLGEIILYAIEKFDWLREALFYLVNPDELRKFYEKLGAIITSSILTGLSETWKSIEEWFTEKVEELSDPIATLKDGILSIFGALKKEALDESPIPDFVFGVRDSFALMRDDAVGLAAKMKEDVVDGFGRMAAAVKRATSTISFLVHSMYLSVGANLVAMGNAVETIAAKWEALRDLSDVTLTLSIEGVTSTLISDLEDVITHWGNLLDMESSKTITMHREPNSSATWDGWISRLKDLADQWERFFDTAGVIGTGGAFAAFFGRGTPFEMASLTFPTRPPNVPELAGGSGGNTFVFEGAFPNVRDGRDAGGVLTELERLMTGAYSNAMVPGGVS